MVERTVIFNRVPCRRESRKILRIPTSKNRSWSFVYCWFVFSLLHQPREITEITWPVEAGRKNGKGHFGWSDGSMYEAHRAMAGWREVYVSYSGRLSEASKPWLHFQVLTFFGWCRRFSFFEIRLGCPQRCRASLLTMTSTAMASTNGCGPTYGRESPLSPILVRWIDSVCKSKISKDRVPLRLDVSFLLHPFRLWDPVIALEMGKSKQAIPIGQAVCPVRCNDNNFPIQAVWSAVIACGVIYSYSGCGSKFQNVFSAQ